MAWLYEHPKSKNWFIGWRVGKKLFNRSTGTSDRKQAEKLLQTHNLMAEANRQKRLTEDFFYSMTGQEANRVPLLQAAADFLEKDCHGRLVLATFVRYKQVLNSFTEFLHAGDKAPLLGDISSEAIQQFLNDQRSRTTAATANFYRSVLKAFFNHAVDNKKLTSSPMETVDAYKASREEVETKRRPFTQDELRATYAAAPNEFWRFAIVCGFYTGLRLGNVATLRWREVDLDKEVLRVVDVKSPDPLEIPICSSHLLNLLREYRRKAGKAKPEDFVFPDYASKYLNKTKHGDSDAAALSMEFRDILVDAKLLPPYQRENLGMGRGCRRKVSPLSFHSLRHTFITLFKERGGSQMAARQLVGHNSDRVNEGYTHVTQEKLRRDLKKLPEVFK